GVDIVDSVGGDVRLGSSPVVSGPPAPAPAPAPAPGDQSITGVRTEGRMRIVRGVGGDVDINP
ncbi:hypothetical protein AB0M20_42370, partial [Actinoplanes sp. NPDC051633]|uniref:hypothetical protein n=1 Tax=Actinoplanes sp. NPDC051633 TaxID=3155670 RepID=UPI00341ADC5E